MDDAIKSRILCVDDEPHLLKALTRVLRGKAYSVDTAENGQAGLELVKDGNYDLIISDMRMPQMDGAEFLTRSIDLSPNSKRILLTGYSDQEATIRAINEGKIHTYMSKPWDNAELKGVVDEALQLKREEDEQREKEKDLEQTNMMLSEQTAGLQTQVKQAESELGQITSFLNLAQDELQDSYVTMINVISHLISMRLKHAKKYSADLVQQATDLAKAVKVEGDALSEIETAARLCFIGKIALADNILNKPLKQFSEIERKAYRRHPLLGEAALTPLEAMRYTARLIRHQNEHYNGSGYPNNLSGTSIPLGSCILKIVIDFHQTVSGEMFGKQVEVAQAIEMLKKQANKRYDPKLLEVFIKQIVESDYQPERDNYTKIASSGLKSGMTLAKDVLLGSGMLLLARSTQLNEQMIQKLVAYEQQLSEELEIFILKDKEEEAKKTARSKLH